MDFSLAVALFLGLAFAAQLEAVRAGVPSRGSIARRTSSDQPAGGVNGEQAVLEQAEIR